VIPENLDEIISAQINLHLSNIREKANMKRNAPGTKPNASERAREKGRTPIADGPNGRRTHIATGRTQRRANAQTGAARPAVGGGWGLISWAGLAKKRNAVGRSPMAPPTPPMPGFPGMEKRKRGMKRSPTF